ncbi:putative O-linked-mannose beta-1-2-N-acetylglucosaminyltransferase 1-like 2, partial [Homarus americanus]
GMNNVSLQTSKQPQGMNNVSLQTSEELQRKNRQMQHTSEPHQTTKIEPINNQLYQAAEYFKQINNQTLQTIGQHHITKRPQPASKQLQQATERPVQANKQPREDTILPQQESKQPQKTTIHQETNKQTQESKQKEQHITGSGDSPVQDGEGGGSVEVSGTVDTTGVTLWLQGQEVYSAHNNTRMWAGEMKRFHAGVHVVVVHETRSIVMQEELFLTWQPSACRMLIRMIDAVQDGRIMIFLGA